MGAGQMGLVRGAMRVVGDKRAEQRKRACLSVMLSSGAGWPLSEAARYFVNPPKNAKQIAAAALPRQIHIDFDPPPLFISPTNIFVLVTVILDHDFPMRTV